MDALFTSNSNLAAAITLAASKQTYYTIRLLADKPRAQQGLQAYAYYRWVDDQLDNDLASNVARRNFIARQQSLLTALSEGRDFVRISPEEKILADLVASDPDPSSGLRVYLQHMMQVMAFDTARRGRLISQSELDIYTNHLAVGVTELLHFLIGDGSYSPKDRSRYAAASAAHIVHMLRDTYEDVDSGYFNVPREVLASAGMRPDDVQHPAYQNWVRERIQLADSQFRIARAYLSRVESLRCRLAGYTYMNRFEIVSALVKKDGYLLRPKYPRRRTLDGLATFLASLLGSLARGTSQTVPVPVSAMNPRKNP